MTWLVAALGMVIVVQLATIVAMLVQRRRGAAAQLALRASEEQFGRIADGAPVMIWTARLDTTLDYVNKTLTDFTGLPVQRLLDNGWLDVVHPEDVDPIKRTYMPAVEARRPFVLEYRARRADGVYRWLLDTGVPKHGPDGNYAGYIGCCIDITERKDAEERTRESRAALAVSQREIQHLAGRLIEAQDAERARIARDLHDDFSQQLAGMSIALSSLKRRMDELHLGEDVREDLRSLQQRASVLAQSARQLSHDLHPTVLRHAGLLAALTTYCAELERAHDTVLTCTAECNLAWIAPDVALCFYRITQEALRNVIAHAGASRADVRLSCTNDTAVITITDDGKGFDVAGSLEQGQGLGLVSMIERVRLVGGTVSVVSDANTGTRVRAEVSAQTGAHSGRCIEEGRRELTLS